MKLLEKNKQSNYNIKIKLQIKMKKIITLIGNIPSKIKKHIIDVNTPLVRTGMTGKQNRRVKRYLERQVKKAA